MKPTSNKSQDTVACLKTEQAAAPLKSATVTCASTSTHVISTGRLANPFHSPHIRRLALIAATLSVGGGFTIALASPFALAPLTELGVSYGLIFLTLGLHLTNIFLYLKPEHITPSQTTTNNDAGAHHEMSM